MKLSPADMRSQSFRAVLRGYDPQQVDAALAAAAEALEIAHQDLQAARCTPAPTDQAIKLTMMTAIRAKDEMLSTADLEVEAVRRAAQDEAEGLIAAAERDAAELMTTTKRQVSHAVRRAEDEVASLELRIEQLRGVVHRTENLMKGMASGALGDLAHASAMLAEDGAQADREELRLQVVVSDPTLGEAAAVNGSSRGDDILPEAVDRLLSQLREIT